MILCLCSGWSLPFSLSGLMDGDSIRREMAMVSSHFYMWPHEGHSYIAIII